MTGGEANGNGKLTIDVNKSFWFSALQTFGFPVVGCLILGWFANEAIRWERDQMIPAITKSQTTIEGNTQALRESAEATKQFKASLDELRKQLPPERTKP